MNALRTWTVACLAAACAAGCGGGGSDTSTRVAVTSVKVMGDSLADSGTFGYRFTVQGYPVYPEIVAASYGAPALCPVYIATSATTFVANPTQTGCTNYAIGGGRINNVTAPTSPVSILQQLSNAAAAGSYAAGDLVVIDGGGNDAADLVGAYLAASSDGGASYAALLSTELPAATVATALGQGASGFAAIGATYMAALADQFAAAILADVVGNGAAHVLVVNMPAITNTPRFQDVLTEIGGADGSAAESAALAVFTNWFTTFNAELAAKLAGNPKVAVFDFYTSFDAEIAAPAQYALTNVTTPVCPVTGTDSTNLPTYTFSACDATLLNSETGVTANWWWTYAFSDSFHPTPYGHQLLARAISKTLAAAGWL